MSVSRHHAPTGGSPQAPLKAQLSGSVFGEAAPVVYGFFILSLGVLIAYLLVSAQIRSILLVLLVLLGMASLSPRRGVHILLMFLPFMYYIRRQVLYFSEFSSRDPVLLFPPLVSVAIFSGLLLFRSNLLFSYVNRSTLLKVFFALLVLFSAQVFNPLQGGGVFTGLAGGIYFITPMLWAVMGLLLDERDIRRILKIVVVIGAITALYGIYQHVFGFTEVERQELEAKDFLKLVGTQERVMSTFAALGDFGLYLATAGFLAFARFWRHKGDLFAILAFGLIAFALLLTASRTMTFTLIFSIVFFLVIQPSRTRGHMLRAVAVLTFFGMIYGYLYTISSEQIYRMHGSSNPFVAHVVGGVAHPTEESTFTKRLGVWSYVAGRGLFEQPLGRGLGSTTTAADKFSGGRRFEVDSYFFEIIFGSSIAAAGLFTWLMVLFLRDSFRLLGRNVDTAIYKTVSALVAGFFLSSVFGASIRDSISGPLAWLLIGWIAKESVEMARERNLELPAP